MKKNEAEKIIKDFSSFLEYTHYKLKIIFGDRIPEILLPHSRENIEKALGFRKIESSILKDSRMMQVIDVAKAMLLSYIENGKALKDAGTTLSNEKWRKAVLEILEKTIKS